MPDKPFFVYFAPGATHAPHHVPAEWSDKYKGSSTRAGTRSARRSLARQKELGVVPRRDRADRSARGDSRLGRHARRAQARARPPDGGLRRLPRAHRPPRRAARRRPRGPRGPRRHARSTTSSATTAPAPKATLNGTFNETVHLQRRGGARDAGVHGLPDRRVRRPRGVQPLRGRLGARDGHALPVDQAGRLALGRHPQRHDRALAERHQARKVRYGSSSTTSSTSRRPSSKRPACPSRRSVHGVEQKPIEGVSMRLLLRRRRRAERRETQYFEMFCNRGIYHQGWTAVTRHSTPWVMERAAAASTRTSGSCTTRPPTGARRTTLRPRCRRSSRSCSSYGSKRRASTTSSRWTTGGSSASTPTSPVALNSIQRQFPAALPRDGAAVRELCHQHQEQVVLRHRRGVRFRRATPRA